MEATSVTGPAKNLIQFARWAKSPQSAGSGLRPEVSIATFSRTGQRHGFVQAALDASIPVHVIKEDHRFDRAVIHQLKELVEAVKPDVVQTHNVKSHFLWKLQNQKDSLPWLAFQHGYTATDLKMKLYNQLDRWSLRSATRVVTVCQAFVPRLLSYGVNPGKVSVLHNSVDPPSPVPAANRVEIFRRYNIADDEPVILSIGRFSKEKGYADLIESLHQLRMMREGPWKAILVGTGPEQPHLAQLVAQRGLTARVVFAGFHSDVSSFYSIASVFALASHSEGSPNVILEAMAARVPIAATSSGGTVELVLNEESALLSPVGNPAALARSLQRLLNDHQFAGQIADSAFHRVCLHFSPHHYRQSLLAIYAAALGV